MWVTIILTDRKFGNLNDVVRDNVTSVILVMPKGSAPFLSSRSQTGMISQRLLFSVFLILPCMVIAQDIVKTPCSFSCPTMDKLSQPLVKRPYAIGFESFYSIFECKYLSSNEDLPYPTCSYYKDSGLQALGSLHDHCIPNAVPCSDSAQESTETDPPSFSNQDKDEVPPWVETGRYLVYLKENHRG